MATRDGHLCEQISIEAVTEFIRPALSAVRLSVADIDEIVRHMTQLSNDDDDGCDFEPRHVSSARSDEENRGNELHSKSVDENLPTSEDNHDELD